jgi:SAM-dependent methyltransferase
MPQNNILEEIWNEGQHILPKSTRHLYEPSSSFCLQERDMRDLLLKNGLEKEWLAWKLVVRPAIHSNRSAKYISKEYALQKSKEYSRRARDWKELINSLLFNEKAQTGSVLIDVGSHEGDEMAGLDFKITCIDPSEEICIAGKSKHPNMKFRRGTADNTLEASNYYDIYISLRTWCVAGVLSDEAFIEAKRILKPNGLLMVSFPLRYKNGVRSWENVQEDNITQVARWTMGLLKDNLSYVKTYAGPEDFFIYGRIKP